MRFLILLRTIHHLYFYLDRRTDVHSMSLYVTELLSSLVNTDKYNIGDSNFKKFL